VRRDIGVLVSRWARTDRQTATRAGRGESYIGSPDPGALAVSLPGYETIYLSATLAISATGGDRRSNRLDSRRHRTVESSTGR
jgi:hypothetical protein